MATYPSTLPDWQLPVSWQAQNGTVRTSMDTGPDKVRRRFSAVNIPFSAEMEIDGSQRATLETFFHDTLKEGTEEFDRTDPRTDTTESFRFLSPPQFRQKAGASSTSERIYQVTMNLEKLP